MRVMFQPVPATGPIGYGASTLAPEMNNSKGAARTLLVAKSIRPACDRAIPVIVDVGMRLAMPATAVIGPPPTISPRLLSIASRTAANRSAASIAPAGAEILLGVNEFPPAALSCRVLTTKVRLKDFASAPTLS